MSAPQLLMEIEKFTFIRTVAEGLVFTRLSCYKVFPQNFDL